MSPEVVYGASTWASRPALSGMSTRKYSRHSFQHTLLGRRRKSPVTPRSTPRNLRQRLDDEVPHPGFGRRRRESGRGMCLPHMTQKGRRTYPALIFILNLAACAARHVSSIRKLDLQRRIPSKEIVLLGSYCWASNCGEKSSGAEFLLWDVRSRPKRFIKCCISEKSRTSE